MYLTAGRRFPTDVDLVVVDGGIWDHFVSRPEYKAKQEADRDSYAWDSIVDIFAEDVLQVHEAIVGTRKIPVKPREGPAS
jgi:hypothetical protein